MEPVRIYAGEIPPQHYPETPTTTETTITTKTPIPDHIITRTFTNTIKSETKLFECSIHPLGARFSGTYNTNDKEGIEDLTLMIKAMSLHKTHTKGIEITIKIIEE